MPTIPAIYENGVFKPQQKVELTPGTRVEVILPTVQRDAVERMRSQIGRASCRERV